MTEILFAAARPLFLRLESRLETTSSLKVIKAELSQEGPAPKDKGGPIYAYDSEGETYSLLDNESFSAFLRTLR